jgi:PAS domain S-box-containing protein
MTDDPNKPQQLDEAERLRLFIGSVRDYAIYILSPEGNVASWNAGAERFKGYKPAEIIGRHFSTFYTEEDRATGLPWRALEIAASEGKFESEGWRVRKDGTRFWASVVIDPIRDDDGQLVGFAKITRDITDRKEAERQLELAREALFQSQKMEAIGKLTGGIAHDFNNLLNVVSNGLDMLRQRARDPADQRLIDTMQQAVSRGSSLNQQLLSFARQQPMQGQPHSLSGIIRGFEPVLRRASRSALHFEFDLASGLPPAKVDSAQFETALLNIVVNARDATGDGGQISVRTRLAQLKEGELPPAPAGSYIEVSVQDTGTGMPPEVAERAFEPFFTTKPQGKGTGLGLSQVYGMVQQAGGTMRIKSAPGEGTTVSMFFPALHGEEAVDTMPPQADTVLVVDDQPEVLEVTCELFRTLGLNAIPARSPREALSVLQRGGDVEFMLTDIVMPGMSGVELARQARELRPSIKVILASGYSGPAHASVGGELDGYPFLPKPYKLADIVRKLREIG